MVLYKIPEIIQHNNKKADYYYIADEEEIRQLLIQKLIEEVEEFKEAQNEEELADMVVGSC